MNVKSLLPAAGAAVLCVIAEAAYAGGSADVVAATKYAVDTTIAITAALVTIAGIGAVAAIKYMHAPPMATGATWGIASGVGLAMPRIVQGAAGVVGGGGAGIDIHSLLSMTGGLF